MQIETLLLSDITPYESNAKNILNTKLIKSKNLLKLLAITILLLLMRTMSLLKDMVVILL